MATETLTLLLKAKDQASKQVSGLTGSVKQLGKVSLKVAKIGLAGLAAGTAALVASSVKASKAALEQEKSQNKLITALRNSNQLTEENYQSLIKQASALQDVSTIGDETTISLQSMAVSLGVSADKASEVVKTALEMEKAIGVDAKTAIKGLTQTLEGSSGALSRYVPKLSKFTKEQLKNGEAVELLSKRYSGFLDDELELLPGALKQASNAWGDFNEQTGFAINKNDALVSATQQITKIIKELTSDVSDNQSVLNRWVNRGVAFVIRGITSMIRTIVDGRLVFNNLKETMLDFIKTAAGAFKNFIPQFMINSINKFANDALAANREQGAEIIKSRNAALKYIKALEEVSENLENSTGKVKELALETSKIKGPDLTPRNNGSSGTSSDFGPTREVFEQAQAAAAQNALMIAEETGGIIANSISQGLSSIQSSGQFIGGAVSMAGQIVGGTIGAALGPIGGAITGVIDLIANGSQETFDKMFDDLANGLTSFFSNIDEFIISVAKSMPKIMTAIIEGVANLIVELPRILFESIKATFKSLGDAFKSLFKKIGKFFTDTLANAFRKLFVKIGNFFRKIGNFFRRVLGIDEKELNELPSGSDSENEFAGGFASGGITMAGKPILVGENGPEIIRPMSNSQVVPSQQITNNNQPIEVKMNVHLKSTDPREAVRELKKQFNDAVSMAMITQSQNPFGVNYGG